MSHWQRRIDKKTPVIQEYNTTGAKRRQYFKKEGQTGKGLEGAIGVRVGWWLFLR